ncbi:MAG: hypothetical protein ACRDIB_08850 [Ardenticatenaceae bacterium]
MRNRNRMILLVTMSVLLVTCVLLSVSFLTRWPEKEQICLRMGIALDDELCRGRGIAKLLAGGLTPGVTTRAQVNAALAEYRIEVTATQIGGVAEVYEIGPPLFAERFCISYDENDLLISVIFVD